MITLREVLAGDLDRIYLDHADPVAAEMAHVSIMSRLDFDEHWADAFANPDRITRVIERDGEFVGHIVSYLTTRYGQTPERAIGYRVTREHWGEGIATAAIRLFVAGLPRPLIAGVTGTNLASQHALLNNGFVERRRSLEPDGSEEVELILQ